ncbi:hypothetical protein S7711_11090 [Stachybotrys chartarum IBT 7711]|uniref:Uncharacterized protein n=1 Tax=Stachybotrys chartarum (strain CBS 109288 / IBT 7711) TaxID=1280523 RepID=A0A084ANN4_STACB|nr:hypothetical protein S7711_11090 [Stachybotrys chartarum IBT 7711]KFA46298.1 hypothetical protein S40293_11077 [Stachybotrys chartarum IBT 40293]KFA79035.1 hypothetical protein S40288_10491 [Stachybotrys chartarum IBT 40288]
MAGSHPMRPVRRSPDLALAARSLLPSPCADCQHCFISASQCEVTLVLKDLFTDDESFPARFRPPYGRTIPSQHSRRIGPRFVSPGFNLKASNALIMRTSRCDYLWRLPYACNMQGARGVIHFGFHFARPSDDPCALANVVPSSMDWVGRATQGGQWHLLGQCPARHQNLACKVKVCGCRNGIV